MQNKNMLAIFKKAMSEMLSAGQKVAVAVSGGGDSVAMARLLQQTIGAENMAIVHFNHNLRPEAETEAQWVQNFATSLQTPCFVETWNSPIIGNKHQSARHARYAFFAEICKQNNYAGVCVGHTKDDVAETMLMRLGRGSGVSGLAAMRSYGQVGGVTVMRPMLEIYRKELREYLEEINQKWLEDPSNRDPKYLRSRMRKGIATLEDVGLQRRAVADAATALRRAETALESVTISFLKNFSEPLMEGGLVVAECVLEQPDEIAQRTIEKIILQLKPAPLAPRVSKRLRMVENFRNGQKDATLGGVKFTKTEAGIACKLEH